jgi:hypothetical protein
MVTNPLCGQMKGKGKGKSHYRPGQALKVEGRRIKRWKTHVTGHEKDGMLDEL